MRQRHYTKISQADRTRSGRWTTCKTICAPHLLCSRHKPLLGYGPARQMEAFWAFLARMPGWFHRQDTLVSRLVDKLESKVCLWTISQSSQNIWWYAQVYSLLWGLFDIYVGAPCVTQSDRGTENFNVAYAHTHIRHMLDPSLSGSIQHQ